MIMTVTQRKMYGGHLQKETVHQKILQRCCHLRQSLLLKKWHSAQRWKKKIILVILSAFLHHFILQIIVKTTVFTVDSTVITASAGQS